RKSLHPIWGACDQMTMTERFGHLDITRVLYISLTERFGQELAIFGYGSGQCFGIIAKATFFRDHPLGGSRPGTCQKSAAGLGRRACRRPLRRPKRGCRAACPHARAARNRPRRLRPTLSRRVATAPLGPAG